jgi:alkylhydroperoxidase/carboxymuconolactone decarboxylase family protein YurZ
MSWPLPFLAPRAQQRPETTSGFGATSEAAVTGTIDHSRRQLLAIAAIAASRVAA